MQGDVDLIGWDGDVLCFVEVKTRTQRDSTPAESAVDEDKRSVVRDLARAYLRTLDETERERFRCASTWCRCMRCRESRRLKSSRVHLGGSKSGGCRLY